VEILASCSGGRLTVMPEIVDRPYPPECRERLSAAGLDPVLARVLAARGVTGMVQLDNALAHLLAPGCMQNLQRLGQLLADAIAARATLLIVADYD
jgi:single-stranded-DNA-specific exonuclease